LQHISYKSGPEAVTAAMLRLQPAPCLLARKLKEYTVLINSNQ